MLERNPALIGTADAPARFRAAPAALRSGAAGSKRRRDRRRRAAGLRRGASSRCAGGWSASSCGEEFVRELLHAGDVLDAHEVALRWAGMPNKNERAATNEVLDALAGAGFLQRDGERFVVVRGPD